MKKEISDRIKEALELRNMKQADLVEKGNFDKGQLSSWISGKYRPRQNNIALLAEILDVNEGWLMGYDVPAEKTMSNEVNSDNGSINTIDYLNSLLNEFPGQAIKYISTLCKNQRIDLDLTEKKVSSMANISLDEYLSFENKYKNIGGENIASVVTSLNLDLYFVAHTLLSYLMPRGQSTNIDAILNRLKMNSSLKKACLAIYKLNSEELEYLIELLNEDDRFKVSDKKMDLIKEKMTRVHRQIVNDPPITLNAAHERTDIEVTDEMRKHDDNIMDDENF